ncbi:MAG: FtsX-like permease family protein [Phycisphaerales bacterium]
MYQSLLTRRYLTSKVMPLLAALAVMLCCAMELIVWSVMGGFLVMLMESGKTLIGDVEIGYENTGIAYYGDLIDRLNKDPLVEAAAPTIETFGLLNLPLSNGARTVVVKGVEPRSFTKVTGFADSLWWRPLEKPLPKDTEARDPRVPFHGYAARLAEAADDFLDYRPEDVAVALKAPRATVDALRDAARRARRLADNGRAVSDEWTGQLREAGASIVALARDTLRTAPPPPAAQGEEALPAPHRAVAHLEARAAAFAYAESMYKRMADLLPQGEALTADGEAAIVLGTQVGGYNERDPAGFLKPLLFLPGNSGTLNVVPMDSRGTPLAMEHRLRRFPIVNQFRSGIFEIDAQTVIVRLDALQRILQMDEGRRIAPGAGAAPRVETGPDGQERFVEPPPTVIQPARVTTILIRAKAGVTADALAKRAREVYEEFADAHAAGPSPPPPVNSPGLRIATWEERNATLIGAVRKETALVMFIFGVISLTSVFLVLAIFWAMVSEKTRDIGVLRAIGASRAGVAWLWIRYGLAIGLIGAVLGGVAAYMIVTNINPIHEWMGEFLGISIWDPRVYYFTTIPSKVDPVKAVIVLASGIVASVIGAAIPAIKAANMHPVRALRWE